MLVAAVVWTVTGGAAGDPPNANAVGRSETILDLSLSGQSQPIPASFLGLSFEYDQLGKFEAAGPLFDRMIAILKSRDGSPMLVRLGGRSADQVYWDPPAGPVPRFVTVLQAQDLTDLGALVRRDRLRVELDLNLAVHSPTMAVAFARATAKALPRGSIAGFAIGNEPDLYKIQPWLYRERVASTLASTPAHWNDHYRPKEYRSDYKAYVRPLLRAFPRMPVAAPDTAFPTVAWSSDLTGLGRLAPGVIAIHRYATAYCKIINFHNAPTILTFLKNGTSAGLASTLHIDLTLARLYGLAVRVTEMNSVTCGGQKGVADAYSTALWAPDALFEMIHAGVEGVNFHIRPRLPNAPFHIDSNGVEPLPEVYGLALYARMIGPLPQLERLIPSIPAAVRVKAWAVSSADGLKLLLINKNPGRVSVRFALPGARRAATIVRLSAPHLESITGVTLGGQSIGPDGRWHGQRVTTSVMPANGVYRLPVPGYTAELVKLGHV